MKYNDFDYMQLDNAMKESLAELESKRVEIKSLKAENAELRARLDERCDTCPAFEALKQKNKDLHLLLFAFVRNSAVLPVGLTLGKSEQEITDKTFETIAEARKMLDVDKIRAAMNLATEKENRYDEE